MDALFFIVPIGVALSVCAFLVFEKRALSSKKLKEAEGLLPTMRVGDIYEKFHRYETLSNVLGFFIASYVISFALASLKYDPSYGIMNALSYIFATTFIGTLIIFTLKIKKNILIQVFAAFLYGAPHIIASSLAFLSRYLMA